MHTQRYKSISRGRHVVVVVVVPSIEDANGGRRPMRTACGSSMVTIDRD
jgi:hypothetical protein